jgi:hypothetical protein
MARVAIVDIAEPKTGYARNKDYPLTSADYDRLNLSLRDLSATIKSVNEKDYGILRTKFYDRYTKAEAILPFRIAFSSVDIPGYGRENPAPIGIAVIGLNNYIL